MALCRPPVRAREDQAKTREQEVGGKQSRAAALPSENDLTWRGCPSPARLHDLENPAQNETSLRMATADPKPSVDAVSLPWHPPRSQACTISGWPGARAVRRYLSGTGPAREQSLEPAWVRRCCLCEVSPLIFQDLSSLICKRNDNRAVVKIKSVQE